MARSCTRKGRRSNRRSTQRGGAASMPKLPASAPNSRAASEYASESENNSPAASARASPKYAYESENNAPAGRRAAGSAKETCLALFKKLLPDSYDFEYMKNQDYKNVQDKTYAQFTQANVAIVEAMNDADCAFYTSLFERITRRNIKIMDLDVASSVGATNVFFNSKGHVVIVSPR